jgi:peptidoglycan/xylan/chitin deacetylase (PgdA/CDA1 family)
MVGRTAEKRPDVVRMIKDKGHEIAVHGWDHMPYYKMEYEQEKRDIERTLETIEKIVGTKSVGHRSPDWNPSKNTVKILHELSNFIWRGDSLDDDLPYIHKFEDGKDIVELPSSLGFDDFGLYGDRGYSPQEVLQVWKDEFDVLYEEGKFYCLTMHPLISGRPAPSKALEGIIAYVKSHEGVWIGTAEEVAGYWLSKSRTGK